MYTVTLDKFLPSFHEVTWPTTSKDNPWMALFDVCKVPFYHVLECQQIMRTSLLTIDTSTWQSRIKKDIILLNLSDVECFFDVIAKSDIYKKFSCNTDDPIIKSRLINFLRMPSHAILSLSWRHGIHTTVFDAIVPRVLVFAD